MKIAAIGSRGYPASYASAEDLVREFGPRFVRDGHEFTVHCWAVGENATSGIREDSHNGLRRVFHTTPGGKISGQFVVALKSSIHAAFSDCDLVFYIFVNSGVFSWIPKLAGKRVFVNVDGIMWKDPKWPWGLRHLFFIGGVFFLYFIADKIITDSRHMQALYRRKFKLKIDWVGYGCQESVPARVPTPEISMYPNGYYLIMSRITPHNLTDIMVDGFIESGSKSHVIVAGHTPDTPWFNRMKERAKGRSVTFLGLVQDQGLLNQLILGARAYLHGHSLGGINPALVRVTGMGTPAICVDTVYNREVIESPGGEVQACFFSKDPSSVAEAIRAFERDERVFQRSAEDLGTFVRSVMSWETIFQQYKKLFDSCFHH
jgi:glycosyltransferase involved in cell wall biosynthesis